MKENEILDQNVLDMKLAKKGLHLSDIVVRFRLPSKHPVQLHNQARLEKNAFYCAFYLRSYDIDTKAMIVLNIPSFQKYLM